MTALAVVSATVIGVKRLFNDGEADVLRLAMEIERSQWPTLDTCYACDDCRAMFAMPSQLHGNCPACGSSAVFDAAAALRGELATRGSGGRVGTRIREMTRALERALHEETGVVEAEKKEDVDTQT